MMQSRRAFLKSMVVLAAAGVTLSPAHVWGAMQQKERSCLVVGSDRAACIVDLENMVGKRVEVGFFAHSFAPHPDPARFVGMTKWERGAAEVNFETGKARQIPIEPGWEFYGHAAYVPEKKLIFFSRVDNSTGKGYLTGYDPETYKIMENFQVTPGGLHECLRMADNTYVVSSSGLHRNVGLAQMGRGSNFDGAKRVAPSALVRVDLLGSGKVISELTIDNPNYQMAHFRVTKAGQILAIGAGLTAAVGGSIYYSPDGKQPLRWVEIPPEMQKEIDAGIEWNAITRPNLRNIAKEVLSIALNGDHTRAAVTYPPAGKIILIDMTQGKVVNMFDQLAKDVVGRNVAYDPVTDRLISGGLSLSYLNDTFTQHEEKSLADDVRPNGVHSLLLPSKIVI
jgi:hypothetical protein